MKPAVRRRGPGKKKRMAASKAPAPAHPEASAPAIPTRATRKAPRKSKGTTARLALHGRYMSSLRKLSKADQAEVKKVRAEKGVDEAIKLAAAKVG